MEKLKITTLDLVIALDTLRGSLALQDGGTLFGYAKKSRETAINNIHQFLLESEIMIEEVIIKDDKSKN